MPKRIRIRRTWEDTPVWGIFLPGAWLAVAYTSDWHEAVKMANEIARVGIRDWLHEKHREAWRA
jgi:hypothetical protein